MAKPSNAVKDRWNAKSYDDLRVRIPKDRKATAQAHAEALGESINAMVNRAILADMGRTEWTEGSDPQK